MKNGKFETQPKFKFGQKVVSRDSSEVFIVSAVIWHENKRFMYLVKPETVIYGVDYDGGYWEEDLEIYEEPKPKKKVTLYNYTYEDSDNIWESGFTTKKFESIGFLGETKLLKTESKEVEYDDV